MNGEIEKKLRKYSSKKKAATLKRFFKTGPGEYAEGDIFLGVKVPQIRKLAKEYINLGLKEVKKLLSSSIHEERLLALLILVLKYSGTNDIGRAEIYQLYLDNTRYINNWDLVDLSAAAIIGQFLMGKSKVPLYTLAKSEVLWERRISIVSTFCFIKNNQFNVTLKIAGLLLQDKQDLIHKAVGWMLREVGKKDLVSQESFLKRYYKAMPRTMLRYAIERFPGRRRQAYLKGKI